MACAAPANPAPLLEPNLPNPHPPPPLALFFFHPPTAIPALLSSYCLIRMSLLALLLVGQHRPSHRPLSSVVLPCCSVPYGAFLTASTSTGIIAPAHRMIRIVL